MDGFGSKKETAIFPKIAWRTGEGLNLNEGDPNWDIAQLALECMTKSIYPDILFVTEEQLKMKLLFIQWDVEHFYHTGQMKMVRKNILVDLT